MTHTYIGKDLRHCCSPRLLHTGIHIHATEAINNEALLSECQGNQGFKIQVKQVFWEKVTQGYILHVMAYLQYDLLVLSVIENYELNLFMYVWGHKYNCQLMESVSGELGFQTTFSTSINLQGPLCVHDVSGTPDGEVRDI